MNPGKKKVSKLLEKNSQRDSSKLMKSSLTAVRMTDEDLCLYIHCKLKRLKNMGKFVDDCKHFKWKLLRGARRIKLSFKTPEIVFKFNHFLRHFNLQFIDYYVYCCTG